MTRTTKEIFRSVVEGNNWLTPITLGYYRAGRHLIVERSTNATRTLFGVTVIERTEGNWERNREKSDVFHSELAMDEHVSHLHFEVLQELKHRKVATS